METALYRCTNTSSSSKFRMLFAGAVLSTSLSQASTPASDPEILPEQRFQLALEEQTIGNYSSMLAYLRQAAERGEAKAQETLAMALMVTPEIFSIDRNAGRCEAIHWMRKAASNGRESARFQLDFINRLRSNKSWKVDCESNVKG